MPELASQVSLAFAAGVLSVLSPCVMPLMPAYLSVVSGLSVEELQGGAYDATLRRRILRSCLGFIAGFTTIFVTMGVGAVAIGHIVRTWRAEILGFEFGVSQIAGAVIVLFGLHMTGLVPIQWLYRDTRLVVRERERNFLSTFLIGAGFAFGWSPCIGPILSSVLTLAGSQETVWLGTGLLLVYSLGLAVPFLAAGWSIEFFFRSFDRIKQHFRALEIAAGTVLVVVGLLVVTGQLTRFNGQLRFLSEWIVTAEKGLL